MEPLDFLAAVLPSAGRYCTFTLHGLRAIFSDTPQGVFDTAKQYSDAGHEVWYAPGSFDASGDRQAVNALYMRSFFMDLDCGKDVKSGKPRSFTTKRKAVEALAHFLVASGLEKLGAPTLVDSGGGVHPYWILEEDVSIAEWKPVAEALKRAAFEHDFPIDRTVTADAARVLRVPGTNNNKTAPRPVSVVSEGTRFKFAELKAALSTYEVKLPSRPTPLAIAGTPQRAPSALASALAGNSVTKFRTIMLKTEQGVGCGQLANYIENATEDGIEPQWRGLLSWTKVCGDGIKGAEIISDMHPYARDRMHQKLSDIKGPYACASMDTIQPGICDKCMHWGKHTNPLFLGREFVVSEEQVEITPPQEDAPRYYRPPTPRGFNYIQAGGVTFHKPANPANKNDLARDVQLLPYDLFMTRQFRDGAQYSSEFVAIKGKDAEQKQVTFVVPGEVMGNPAKIVDTLASKNILAMNGTGNDKYLAAYVRACVDEYSVREETVNIPPNFGWQDDGSFAVGDMVYSPNGEKHDFAYNSDRLRNLILATRTGGTLEDWKKPWEMLRRRKSWGLLTIGLQGFSSILMHFMPKNSRGCTIHVCSKKSGAGKTLALSLCSNVWGDNERYKVSAKTSLTTMMQRAGLWGSLPLNVDESTDKQRESKGEFIPQVSFAYSECAHKIKGSASGNTEISHELMWSGKMVLTSNDPAFEAMLGARQHTSHGEVRRLLEYQILGTEGVAWTDEEREALKHVSDNYGVAGRKFAIWCARNQDTVRDVCKQMYDYWRQFSAASDDERVWTSSIAADMATTILLNSKHADIIDIPVSPIRDFWMGIVTTQRDIIRDNVSTAIDLIHRYIADNNGSFVKVKSGLVTQALMDFGKLSPDSPKGAIRGRVEYNTATDTAMFFVEEKLLRVHCAAAGVGFTPFLAELGTQAAVVPGMRKDLLAGTNGPSMRVKCVQITQPLTAVHDDD